MDFIRVGGFATESGNIWVGPELNPPGLTAAPYAYT